MLELTPDLVGATETQNSGIIGERRDLNLEHTGDVRPSQLLYELTRILLCTSGVTQAKTPKLHLFGQLKRIAKQWLDGYLVCKGGTYPAQLKYKMLADMACNRIIAAHQPQVCRRASDQGGARSVQSHWLHDAREFQHVAKPIAGTRAGRRRRTTSIGSCSTATGRASSAASPNRIRGCIAYTKNHNLGLEVPYRYGSEMRKYRPDFIVLVDDGHGADDPLHLVVEIKGYRREDAKEKKSTMDTYWVPGVNHLGDYGRWAFAEFTEVYQIESDFKAKVESEFNKMIESATAEPAAGKK